MRSKLYDLMQGQSREAQNVSMQNVLLDGLARELRRNEPERR